MFTQPKNVNFICFASLFRQFIINVDQKIRTLWKWEKLELILIISYFFSLFSLNSQLEFFFFGMNDKYLPHEDLFQCDTIRQDNLLILFLLLLNADFSFQLLFFTCIFVSSLFKFVKHDEKTI